MPPPHVIVYTSRWCGYCGLAKSLLAKKGVAYEEVDLTHDAALRDEVVARSGQRTVPQVFIDDQPCGGYTDLLALDRSGRLDELLGLS